jgi:hypothetical protein
MGNVAADTKVTVVVDTTMMAAVDTTKSGDPDAKPTRLPRLPGRKRS